LHTFHTNAVVKRVVDGDSLELRDGRRIRLLGVNAPEKGNCMHEEAKMRLAYLTEGYHVQLKDSVTDGYGRTLANVIVDEPFDRWMNYLYARFISRDPTYIPTAFVNRVLVEEGLAEYTSVPSQYSTVLKASFARAKSEKRGIYSPLCLQTEPVYPGCTIKGNSRNGKKTYFFPECGNYDQVDINTAFGDQWFCSVSEAESAGFSCSKTCIVN